MRTKVEHMERANMLARLWQALGFQAVAFARACRALEDYDPRRALMLAERLEVWLQFALFRLVADIGQLDTARAEACGEESGAETTDDERYLHRLAACLALLAGVIAQIKHRLLARLSVGMAVRQKRLASDPVRPAHSAASTAFAYFDTS